MVKDIGIDWVAKKILDPEFRGMVIEATSGESYLRVHLPGAIQFGINQLEDWLQYTHPGHETEIVIYAEGPECDAPKRIANFLEALGFSSIYIYAGGKDEWIESGLPMETVYPTSWEYISRTA